MLRIGLTGGIGSGKSTVAAMFAQRGVPVIDTDEIARETLAAGSDGYTAVIREFGESVLDRTRNIDRAKLRERVFDDPNARRRLEDILHPRIRADVEARMARLRSPYCVVVVPLLVETNFIDLVDRVLVVDADEEQQITRAMARSRLPRAAVQKVLAAQSPRPARLAQADEVITNNADLAALEAQVDALDRRYQALAGLS